LQRLATDLAPGSPDWIKAMIAFSALSIGLPALAIWAL
jgi:hypothetical protein